MMENIEALFNSELVVVNIGLERFAESMKLQHVPCVHVEWKPPAGGDTRLIEILEKLSN